MEPEQTLSIKTAGLFRMLETESMQSCQALFAQFSDLPQGATPAILNDANGESLAIVCMARDVPIAEFYGFTSFFAPDLTMTCNLNQWNLVP